MKKFIFYLFLAFSQFQAKGQSDNCSNATPLTINSICTFQQGSTIGATQSISACSGNANDDVWYYFIANAPQINILIQSSAQFDAVVQVFSGSCGALNSIICKDATGLGQNEDVDLVGLVQGQQYFMRVYDYSSTNGGNFSICLTGSTTVIPSNDEPCSAIMLPEVTSSCNYSIFSTVGSSATTMASLPTSCMEGSSPQQGGFSINSKDVWFKILVPETGRIHITSKPNMGQGAISDGVMALYSGNCNSLNQISCSDDHSAYPGISNDLLPLISENNLIPGSYVYLRFWGYGTSTGSFGICVTTSTNDECDNALYICDINGYSATTSGAYTADRPSNMQGNNEDVNGTNMTDGINTGGVFGQAGPWGAGASGFNVTINNNSWIRFTAASATANLNVVVYDCWTGNYPFGGLQMQVFSGINCSNFIPVSDFKENSTGFTLTASNLTPGMDYYLMVDGFAGDICGYTISAESGIQFPDISEIPPICSGDTTTIYAPIGATSYLWQNGDTTQNITVSPTSTQTFTCEVTGLCDFKQLLETTINVLPNPIVDILNGDSIQVCLNEQIELNANGADFYQWEDGPSTDSWTISTPNSSYYSVVGESNGCLDQDSIFVQILEAPLLELYPLPIASSLCENSSISLSAYGAQYHFWELPNGTTIQADSIRIDQLQIEDEGTYTILGIDEHGCISMDSLHLVINSNPLLEINATDTLLCLSENILITAFGAENYQWSGPNNFASTNSFFSLNSFTVDQAGWYKVIGNDLNECTSEDSIQIMLKDASDCFLIPELITPNNDGKNDVWHIQGLDPSLTYTIEIFNRWGNRIFMKSEFENDWDCRSNCGLKINQENGLVPTGTYFFILRAGDQLGSVYKGSLEIQY
jgi:gliding motility-associated-like protein